MSAIPAPPPIEPREIFPIQMTGGAARGEIRDFRPHVVPANAETPRKADAAPKGVDAVSSSSQETLEPQLNFDPDESQETSHPTPPAQETESTQNQLPQQSAPDAEIKSPPSSSPIGSSPTSAGKIAAPAPVTSSG